MLGFKHLTWVEKVCNLSLMWYFFRFILGLIAESRRPEGSDSLGLSGSLGIEPESLGPMFNLGLFMADHYSNMSGLTDFEMSLLRTLNEGKRTRCFKALFLPKFQSLVFFGGRGFNDFPDLWNREFKG